jgi:hypothetical protein
LNVVVRRRGFEDNNRGTARQSDLASQQHQNAVSVSA